MVDVGSDMPDYRVLPAVAELRVGMQQQKLIRPGRIDAGRELSAAAARGDDHAGTFLHRAVHAVIGAAAVSDDDFGHRIAMQRPQRRW